MIILLDEIMKQRKLSLRHVARLTGISKSEIGDIRNRRVFPTLDTLEKICAGLKICYICELIKLDGMDCPHCPSLGIADKKD